MFLSRSSLIKTVLFSALLLLIGTVFFIAAYFIGKGDVDPVPSVTVGVILTCLAAVSAFTGIYADSISKPFSEGTRLVKKDLQPKKYIEIFKEKSEGEGYVVARPRFDMLELLYNAYDLLDDKHGRAAVIAAMKEQMKPSYKGKIAVYAADEEYRAGNAEEGDRLLSYAENHDSSSTVSAMADAVRKTSKAAYEKDTETQEKYYTGLLSASGIFKADNASTLVSHWHLYNICKDTGRDEEAQEHLSYCVKHGGATAISRKAKTVI